MKTRFLIKCFISLFIILFIIYIYIFGATNLLHKLGWATSMLAILPLVLIFALKTSNYHKISFLFSLLFIGFISLNHLIYYLSANSDSLTVSPLTLYLIVPPMILIYVSFGGLFDNLIKKTYITKEEKNMFLNLRFFPFYIILFSTYLCVFFLNEKIKLSDSVYLFLIFIILSMLVIYFFIKKLSFLEIEYALRPIPRITTSARMPRLIITTHLIFLSFSFLLEYLRGLWLLGSLCIILLFLMLLTIWQFYKHIFFQQPDHIDKLKQFPIPQIWNKRFLVINFIVLVVVFPILFGIIKLSMD